MKILFKITTRDRRAWFLRLVDSIYSNINNKRDCHILISVDEDDDKMKPNPELKLPHTYKSYKKSQGEVITKISAINRDVNDFDYNWDILVNCSDDQVFTKKGFDDIIRDSFSDGLDKLVHFPDGNRSDLCTLSIIGKDYYNRDKYIYYPEYLTECCDDEAQEVAKIRGCYRFVNNQIFDHLHVAYLKAPADESYRINLSSDKQIHDRMLLQQRRNIKFGL